MVGERGIAGSALIEFTLFAPLLVVASIYTMDFGLLFYKQLEMQNAAQAGADWAMTNHTCSTSKIAAAAANATKLPAIQITVTSSEFCGCPSSTGVALQNPSQPAAACGSTTDICSGGATCSGGALAGNYVTVTAAPSTTYRSLIPYGLITNTYNITATSTVRIQ
jgi:Flp pilus assembly protein TadG